MKRGSLGRSLFSPVGPPFRTRVSHHLDHAPSLHPAHRTGRAQLRHPALGQDSPARGSRRRVGCASVMASEASEPLNGVARLTPISRLLAASTMGLELRSLPSTGVTRLPRYYEPLRHPGAPGLSLAGVRLVIAGHATGLPVLRTLSLYTCRRHYPGAAAGRTVSLTFTQPCQPSPKGSSGRPAHRPFRGLLGVHSRCGLHTRAVT